MMYFKKVAVGGTFDQLHRGHRALLGKAFEVGEKVVIGLTSDEFVAKMAKPHKTAPYNRRKRELEVFLKEKGFEGRAEIVPLKDSLGLMMAKDFDALVVSEETAKVGEAINKKRLQVGFAPLQIVTVLLVPAENCIPISTTRIRSGEIDRNGHMLGEAATV
jgi:pantetheine-phosphate adenylyltransferase